MRHAVRAGREGFVTKARFPPLATLDEERPATVRTTVTSQEGRTLFSHTDQVVIASKNDFILIDEKTHQSLVGLFAVDYGIARYTLETKYYAIQVKPIYEMEGQEVVETRRKKLILSTLVYPLVAMRLRSGRLEPARMAVVEEPEMIVSPGG